MRYSIHLDDRKPHRHHFSIPPRNIHPRNLHRQRQGSVLYQRHMCTRLLQKNTPPRHFSKTRQHRSRGYTDRVWFSLFIKISAERNDCPAWPVPRASSARRAARVAGGADNSIILTWFYARRLWFWRARGLFRSRGLSGYSPFSSGRGCCVPGTFYSGASKTRWLR